MRAIISRSLMLAFAAAPVIVVFAQQAGATSPPAEQVFKDIQVFKGVPANDLIPAMQFMSASMNYTCVDCHDPKDYAAPHKNKDTTRKMIVMQREINEKHFNNRLEVTCMSCHNKEEHPVGMVVPEGVSMRHPAVRPAPKPADLFAKHAEAAGVPKGMLVRTGSLTAPKEVTYELETTPLELTQAPGGKFRLVAGDRKVGSDGTAVWYGPNPLADEPAAIFARIGRGWFGDEDFKGVVRPVAAGKDTVNGSESMVVQGQRSTTSSTEELYFDNKSGLLSRLVNIRRSTVGMAISAIDYSEYKKIGDVQVPMKVAITFADGQKWSMEFKDAKVLPTVDEKLFKSAG
jgi:photosynthetic reaction center cytochrome c subunit